MLANAVDTLNAGVDALREVDWDGMSVRERLAALDAVETAARRLRAVSGTAMASLAGETAEVLGDRAPKVIADKLRISPAEAKRRLREAGLVADRATLTGTPVPPILETTAKQWHAGALDPEHVKVIAGCLAELPVDTPFDKRVVGRELSGRPSRRDAARSAGHRGRTHRGHPQPGRHLL